MFDYIFIISWSKPYKYQHSLLNPRNLNPSNFDPAFKNSLDKDSHSYF